MPRPANAAILERAWAHVASVPYRVTARWLFYRLLQDGSYSAKGDYHSRFLPLTAKARKDFYEGWRPDTLADDTREAIPQGFGYADFEDWLKRDIARQRCVLDRHARASTYTEIWFEAKAMRGQFEHYAGPVTLRPFGGDPSIPFKWETARHLNSCGSYYGKPIRVLYFGDLDPKGLLIPESALADIRLWYAALQDGADPHFEFVRVGLNPDHIGRFGLLENPDRPGTYQWEALADDQAASLIREGLGDHLSEDALAEIEAEEDEATERFRKHIQRWLDGGSP